MSDSQPPRPSATVVLLRDAGDGFETFLVRRHGKAVFGDMWAFPGGVVEANDARVVHAYTGLDGASANRLLEAPNGLMYYGAAIRELFEETGVLLGDSGASRDTLAHRRDALNAGKLAWEDFVVGDEVRLDCGALHYFSYWITPRGLGKRFATRFFVAAMPGGQEARHCGGELTDSTWLSAASALTKNRAGELPMIPPTRMTLEFLARHDSRQAVFDAADTLAAEGVVETLPKAVVIDGKRAILMPGDPGYAEAGP